jgi:hypothetical protein
VTNISISTSAGSSEVAPAASRTNRVIGAARLRAALIRELVTTMNARGKQEEPFWE